MGFTPDADPTNPCGRETIGDGWIQPHGVLMVLDDAGTIIRLAGDTLRALGLAPEAVLGQPVTVLVDRDGLPLADALGEHVSPCPDYVIRWRPGLPGQGAWDVTGHAKGAWTILEFEPAPPVVRSAADGMAELGRAMAALDSPQCLEDLLQAAASQVRGMTGFDRVWVYRCRDDGLATAVAEARGEALPSLRDHTPASGMTRRARSGSPRNRCPAIPDANYTPAILRAAGPADTATPVDLSDCSLRSVPPIQRVYLQNLGVAAALSIPVMVDDRLWGTITCHHAEPRHVPYALRETCRHFGGLLSRQIAVREQMQHRRQRASLRSVRSAWLDGLRVMLDAGQPLVLEPAELAGLVPCDGMALVARARVERFGHAPDPPDIRTLAGWLEAPLRRGVYATGHLARELPSAAHYAAEGSGVLAIAVDCPEPVVLMWFRVGERSRVAPPGNPREAEAPAAGESSPRTSAARPWTRAETGTISRFGRSLASLVQQQTLRDLNGRLRDALAEQRTLVAQKNLLMMEVHHRVQNSLQIVNSMLQLQARQTHDVQVRGQFQSAVNRLMAVSAVHRHLWQSSDAQNVHLGPYLRELCTDLTRSWGEGWSGHVAVTGGEVVIPSHMAVTLALLITELLTNAAKYAYGGAPGPVTVQVLEADGGALQVSVADHGRGMQAEVQGSGLGSKLIRIFTSQLGGRVDTRAGAAGTKVTIVVPLMHRHGTEPTGSVNGARA